MDTILIKRLLKSFNCFKGVYSSDNLPYDEELPLNIIVNTDPSNRPGEHWVAISINKNGKGEYFDSFGLPPLVPSIKKFLYSKCNNGCFYNNVQLQNIFSTTCGHYCVLFIIYHCQGYETKQMISKFNSNTPDNDIRINEIFNNFSFVKKV